MHSLINAIVYAPTEHMALKRAEKLFLSLTKGSNSTFDYFVMFREMDDGSGVAGASRWGNLPAVSLVTSPAGKKLIRQAMNNQKQRFTEALNVVREGIEKYTNDELFEDEIVEVNGMKRMFRYYANCLGQYKGSEVQLYDDDGEGIRTERHLKDVLTKYACLFEDQGKPNPNKHDKVWVIPADVHY